jgi:PE family
MSYVNAIPQAMADAAGNLASIGSTINTANASAAAGTSGVKAPGGDPVSAFVSALFAVHAQNYQVAGAQAANFHDQFVQTLREGAASYARAEAANATPLHNVAGVHSGPSQTGAGQHGAVSEPLPASGATTGPSGGNVGGGAQGGNAGGGGANGVPGNVGGEPSAASNGGGAGEVVDPGAAGGGAVNAGAAGAVGAGVPPAWGPVVPAAPTAPVMPGSAPAPGASAIMAGGYPAPAGLAGLGAGGFSGDSAFGGMGEPAATAASSAAAVPPPPGLAAAQPAIPTARKVQSVQPGNQAHSGDPAHPASTQHDIPALLSPLPRLRLRGLREKLHLRSGLRDKSEWQKELREAAESKPWGREELLSALGLRPPGSE